MLFAGRGEERGSVPFPVSAKMAALAAAAAGRSLLGRLAAATPTPGRPLLGRLAATPTPGRPLLGRLAAAAVTGGSRSCVCQKSTYNALPNDYNCKVELALTSDGRTIVCYHPSMNIPYEHTKPIPRPSPVDNKEETHDQVLKARLDKEVLRDKQGPTIEELSKMFYTTKHRWYPVGQYHRRRIKPNPPKDR